MSTNEQIPTNEQQASLNGHHPQDEVLYLFPTRTIVDAYKADKQDWLIQGVFRAKASGYLYGDSGSAKSGLIVETAMRIAYDDLDWYERKIKHGCVVIICGEGEYDILLNIRAFIEYYPDSYGNPLPKENDNLLIIPEGIPIDNPQKIDELVRMLQAWLGDRELQLIVFDTLATCLEKADETKNADMSKVNNNMRILQRKLNCSTLIVHHSGKDESRGMRGASALRNDADMVMQMEKDIGKRGIYFVTVQKLKGRQIPDDRLYFKQEIITLPTQDNFGDQETGYILLKTSQDDTSYAQAAINKEEKVIDVLEQYGELNTGNFKQHCKDAGIGESDFKSIKEKLIRSGQISERGARKEDGEHSAEKFYRYVNVVKEMSEARKHQEAQAVWEAMGNG